MTFSANPADSGFYENPYPVYDEMRSLGACFYWEEYDQWCFPGYAEVSELLRDRRFGCQLDLSEPDPSLPALSRFNRNVWPVASMVSQNGRDL